MLGEVRKAAPVIAMQSVRKIRGIAFAGAAFGSVIVFVGYGQLQIF